MIDDRRLLISVIVLAVIGVLGLFIYSTTLEPLSLDIGEIGPEHVGSVVRTQGTISKVRPLSEGSLSMTVCDFGTSSSIAVFYSPDNGEATAGLLPGALISIQGEVELYEGTVEISVSKTEDIAVLSAANVSVYDMDVLMQSIPMFDGMNVTTSGQIVDIEPIQTAEGLIGTGFCIVWENDNISYSLECFCYGRDLSIQYDEWNTVSVTGMVSYYTANGCWQMTVETVAPA